MSQARTITANFGMLGPAYWVTEYYLTTGMFTNSDYALTLDHALADDYFILVRGSKVNDGASHPDNDYARVVAVPDGRGDLPDSGASNAIWLARHVADFTWEGVVTVVECMHSSHAAGFRLLDVIEAAMTNAQTSGSVASAAWSDVNRVVPFGGYRGGGAQFEVDATASSQGASTYVRLYPSGTDTINWQREAAGETLRDVTMTIFVIEWGSEWTVQHANVSGSKGGNGADATNEYAQAAISSVARDRTWVWGTGRRNDAGIGDCAEACLVTLGDGVNQNANESQVAVGSEYTDAYNFDVYVMTHADLTVDYRFKPDGDTNVLDKDVPVDTFVNDFARFGWVYNGCNGTGTTHPRSRFWARFTGNSTVTISRGYDGVTYPAWVQAIDFSGLDE
jgi:hypothetical protein